MCIGCHFLSQADKLKSESTEAVSEKLGAVKSEQQAALQVCAEPCTAHVMCIPVRVRVSVGT